MLYLGVTGSRETRDRDRVFHELTAITREQDTYLIVGDQKSHDPVTGEFYGLDHLAYSLWTGPDNPQREYVKQFTADWQRYGKRAGAMRNNEMVKWALIAKGYNPGSTLQWLAFFQHGAANHGTAHCANLARRKHIEVTEIWMP